MLRFEWNALRVGDAVVVHDPAGADFALIEGTVVMLETKHAKRSVNGLGIRVEAGDGHRVVWPSYLTVHHDPPDPGENCWRCGELNKTAVPQLVASAIDPAAVAP